MTTTPTVTTMSLEDLLDEMKLNMIEKIGKEHPEVGNLLLLQWVLDRLGQPVTARRTNKETALVVYKAFTKLFEERPNLTLDEAGVNPDALPELVVTLWSDYDLPMDA